MRETCPKEEYLEIAKEVLVFAKEVLSEKKIEEANELSEELTFSRKKRDLAISKLRSMMGMKPKRPMFYLNIDLRDLPYHTRNPMRYLGDYIDHLVKYCTADNLKNERYLSLSLGSNLKNLKGIIPEELRLYLIKYNNVLYVPAKHDFNVPIRRHRFTSKEVVFTCFITLGLSKKLILLSQRAKDYSENKIDMPSLYNR